MQEDEGGNGELTPCWFSSNCQLAKDQRAGNDILTKILGQLENLNNSLVAPATGENRVPLRLVYWIIGGCMALLVLQKVIDSGYEAAMSGAGGHFSVSHGEKKTE